MIKKILFVLIIATAFTSCKAQEPAYLFTYFKGNGEDGLHLAYSTDALNWKSLNNDESILTPEVGEQKLMRDPAVIKGGDGLYHMVWTTGWTERGIGYASSEDLVNWSEQQLIPVMQHEETARNCWAPEITYDAKNDQYMIYWATTIPGLFPETQSKADDGYNHRMYYILTKDFKDFTKAEVLYEPGFNSIDATIQWDGEQYVMFLKDETREPARKNLKVAFAENLTGPYSEASEPITGKYWAEGPTAIQKDGKWIVYFDKYTDHQYGAVMSEDLKNWTDISDKVTFPDGIRHGTVICVSTAELKQIQEVLVID
ncbi:glycoside hydrolase family 43 protein [Leeuwenhoekiella sp. MAR_2009_132]|uniref:glycoside hydrolase family 43 protein n=1 Tax=Leeuwenhoekiella sp. MAR_2009_132 TaxID=1392489 RepID=UPI000491E621|nr:glycoside hydrolase family 43 protein [Leeuwenhoekiella sp. MAR_2009_132]